MPLTDLLVGTTANDGFGETLRSGGQKINTNYTFTVTTDTAQTITGAKTFSAAVATPLEVSRNVNGGIFFNVTNNDAGSSARSSVRLFSDDANGEMAALSSTNVTTSQSGRASTFTIRTGSGDSSGGIAIMARNAAGIITLHSGGNTERMRIAANGTVQLPSGSPGIKFGTRNANLDDYEEGTWTTTFGTQINLTGTPILDGPHFTKIGRVVHIAARITGLSITSSSTQTSIVLTLPVGFGTATNATRVLGVSRLSQGVVVGYVQNNTVSNNTEIILVFRAGAVVSTGSTVIDFSLTYIS